MLRNVLRMTRRFTQEMVVRREIPGVFHDKKAIFIHIPKAAGTSISNSLFGYSVGHSTVLQRYSEDYESTKKYFKFTFVREPGDRLRSAYRFLRSDGMHVRGRTFAENHIGDDDFPTFVRKLRDGAFSHLLLLPQMAFIATFDNKVLVNFVGRYESLVEDFTEVCERIGAKVDLQHKLRTKADDLAIDPQTAAIIRDIYERDYTWLSY